MKKSKFLFWMDIFFIVLLFCGTLFELPIFGQYINEREISFVLIGSIWGVFKLASLKLKPLKLSIYDVFIFGLFIYLCINFYFFSNTTLYYSRFWSFLGYFFAFYLFQSVFHLSLKRKNILHYILVFILLCCFVQSIIALLQYYNFLEGENEYFKVVGTFSSPNLLGIYLGFGLSILLWYFFVYRIKNKKLFGFALICLLLIGTVFILTNSRGSWIGFTGAVFVFFITSKKGKSFICKLSFIQKGVVLTSLGLLLFIGGKFLYSLNKESVDGRNLVAKITLQEMVKKPVFGHGLFNFAGKYNHAKADYFHAEERPWEEIKVGNYVFTPFNDYLLIGYELGIFILLALLVFGIVILFKTKITSETRVGIAVLVNVSIWALFNSALRNIPIMLVGIVALSLVFVYGNVNKRFLKIYLHSKHLKVLLFIVCSLGVFAVYSKISGIQKFTKYVQNKNAIEKNSLIRLSRPLENNYNNDFMAGRRLYALGHKKAGIDLMEWGFQKTSAPKIGRPLAKYHLKDGNYKRAEEIYAFNIGVQPFRYKPQKDFISLMKKVHDYKEIVQRSKKVIDFPVKIPSPKVIEYKQAAKKNLTRYTKYVKTSSILQGTLSKTLAIKSKLLNAKFLYKVYLPPISKIDKKLPVVYFNDGRSYLKKGNAAKILDSLISHNIIRPVAAVFLEAKVGREKWKKVRQELFLCNPVFVGFFTEEFMPHIERIFPVSKYKEDRTIMGISFGGLAAAYLANSSEKSFKNIVMQSPSFYPCPEIYSAFKKAPTKDFNIYLSYGTGKDTQKQSLPMIQILKDKGYPLKVERIEEGNHSWEIWKEQLAGVFMHFFKR